MVRSAGQCGPAGRRSALAIGSAVQRGSYVYVYDEKGRQIASVPAGESLQGYTGSTVSVRRGSYIYTYDERGRQVSSTPAR